MIKKEALFKIGYGLYILTANDGKNNGCVINTVMQITDTPLRIAICVNKANHTHDMILKTKKFNVSCLTEKTDFALIERFGFKSGKDIDKFEGFSAVFESDNGICYITDSVNTCISAEVFDTKDLGTHTMFFADVTETISLSDENSLTYDYYFKNIKPAPEAKKKGYVCKICGYVYEGETLPEDYICPICKHGKEDFEAI